jgi:hypothetical protein
MSAPEIARPCALDHYEECKSRVEQLEQKIAELKAQMEEEATIHRALSDSYVAMGMAYEELKAQLTAQGWQDIKDAPRDGALFDCLCEMETGLPISTLSGKHYTKPILTETRSIEMSKQWCVSNR